MADIGVISGVVGIVGAAFASCKSLHDFIDGMRNAPREFDLLTTDLIEVTRVLDNFNKELESQTEDSNDARRTVALKTSLEQVQPCVKELGKACDEFKEKLENLFARSMGERTSRRDRFKFPFQEKSITAFRYRLASYKETISIALNLATLKTTSGNSRGIEHLEQTVESASVALAGQIKGMEISIQSLVDSNLAISADKENALTALEEQKLVLQKCLAFCVEASAQAAEVSGHKVRSAKVQDEAKQLIGNIGHVGNGGPGVIIDELTAQDKAKQMAGSISAEVALAFMNSPGQGSQQIQSDHQPRPSLNQSAQSGRLIED